MSNQEELRANIRESLCALCHASSSPDTTTEVMNQITKNILELFKHPNSIVSCINIIFEDTEEPIRYACSALVIKCFGNNWEVLNPYEKGVFLKDILTKMVNIEQSERVKHVLVNTIDTKFEENTVSILLEIASDVIENSYAFSVCLDLMIKCYKLFNMEEETIQLLLKYVETGLNSNNQNLIINVLELNFKYYHHAQEECDNENFTIPDVITDYWLYTLELLSKSIEDENMFSSLCSILIPCIEENDTFIKPEKVYETVMQLLNLQEITGSEQSFNILHLFNAFLSGLGDLLLNPEYASKFVTGTSENVCVVNILNIYNRYHEIISSEYNGLDDIELTRSELIKELAIFLGQNDKILVEFWENINSFVETEYGAVTFLIFLYYSFEPGQGFYSENLDSIVDIFITSLKNESSLIRSSALSTLISFCEIFFNEVDLFSELLLEAVFSIISQSPSISAFNAASNIFLNTKNTDELFDTYYSILFELLGSSEDPDISNAILDCIANMICNASEKAYENAEQIYQTIIGIVCSDSEVYIQCRSSALKCISPLIQSAQLLFQQNYSSVLEFLNTCLSSEDPSLIVQSLNAYGNLYNILTPEIIQSLEPPIEIIQNLIQQEPGKLIEKHVNSVKDNLLDTDEDEQPFLNKDLLNYPGLALKLLTTCMYNFPNTVESLINPVVEYIENFCNSVYSNSVDDGLTSINLVMKGLKAVGVMPPEIIMKFILIIKQQLITTESQSTAEEAILSLSSILNYATLQNIPEDGLNIIIDMYNDLFSLELPISSDGIYEIQDCLTILSRELFASFGQNIANSIDQTVFKYVVPMVQSNNIMQAYFAIEVLGFYYSNKTLPDELVGNIIRTILILESKKIQYEGFFFLSVVSEKNPDLFATFFELILPFLLQVLNSNLNLKLSRNVEAINLLLTCLINVKNIMGSNFPTDLASAAAKYSNLYQKTEVNV